MSGQLAKARLVALDEIKGTGKDPTPSYREQDKSALYVQFNPTSLKISRTNNQDRGASTTKSQARTNPSAQSATLTFDLEFDTAELSDAQGVPVDVRSLTKIVRRFAEPTKEKPTSPPPPVRFVWGTFIFQGLVTQLTEDLDYFSNDGYPLRAKVSVTITEKNPDWEAKKIGEAARSLPSATPTGSGQGSGPGSKPASNPDTTAQAQDGESLQQLLTRVNADPAAWRSAMAGLDSPLGLAAGAQVQIAAGASAALGIGAAAGFSLGAGASASATLGAALGVSAGASASADLSASAGFTAAGGVAVDGEAAAGFSLAEGGGVAASYAVVAAAGAQVSVAAARGSFSVPTGAEAQGGAAASIGAVAVGGLAAGAGTALDPRAQGYGAGVPLRARAQATTVVSTSVGGSGAVTARASSDELALSTSTSVPAWQQLSASAAGRAEADAQQRSRDGGDSTLRWAPGR